MQMAINVKRLAYSKESGSSDWAYENRENRRGNAAERSFHLSLYIPKRGYQSKARERLPIKSIHVPSKDARDPSLISSILPLRTKEKLAMT